MQRSLVRFVRLPFFGKSTPAAAETDAKKLTKEQQAELTGMMSKLRTDAPRKSRAEVASDGDAADHDGRIDMDSIRARGLLKYRYTYTPAADVSSTVLSAAVRIAKECGVAGEGADIAFADNNHFKCQLLSSLSSRLSHAPANSRLLHLKTVADVVAFYEEPVSNLTAYSSLARSSALPPNVHAMEQPARFNPEDEHAWHGGVTAFPGSGGSVSGLRNKRLLRQFKPKEEWFDYEDQAFDFTRPDKDMPWDPEMAKRMDRYPDKRHNLKTHSFNRI